MVDDARFERRIVKEILDRTRGVYTLAGEAADGREAVGIYARTRPDFVMMDIIMPVLDGISAIREILASDPGARIIACSAMGQETLLGEALDAGARDFIVKPVTRDKLLAALERHSGE